MKITFIIHDLSATGGTNRVATELCNLLCDAHEVTIISRDLNLPNYFNLSEQVCDKKIKGGIAKFIFEVRRLLENIHSDIVIMHAMSKLSLLFLLYKPNVRLWSIEHTTYISHSFVYRIARKFLYGKLDKIICLTNSDALNYQPINKNVVVMRNPSSLEIIDAPIVKNSNIVVSIGNLVAVKGYDLLLRAWHIVESKHPSWHLHIYGEGVEKNNLLNLKNKLNINNAFFKGITNSVASVYDLAEIYVLSSHNEGLSMVLIEAQSRGVPIISFDCQYGPPEIITDNVDGYLVSSGDYLALADKIIYLINNKTLRTEFAKQGLISARRFSKDAIKQQWLKLIQE